MQIKLIEKKMVGKLTESVFFFLQTPFRNKGTLRFTFEFHTKLYKEIIILHSEIYL